MSNNINESNCSDLPATEDLLGTDEQQLGLVKFMCNCGTPMTIAIQGDWGTGKTSTMKQLQERLKKEKGSTLWFPTWQFAVLGEQDRLLMDLLMLLCSKLEEKFSSMNKKDKTTFNKVFRFLKRVGRANTIGNLYLAAEVGKTITKVDVPKVVDNIVNDLEKQDLEEKNKNVDEDCITYESYVVQVSKLYEDLTRLVEAYLKKTKTSRLYIFIDDLDRLEPIRAVELLEGIKNFLDIPDCVFILAIDTNVVLEGLMAKYGDTMDNKKMIHFFDKIIQVPYKLPVHNYKLRSFLKEVLKGYDEENSEKYLVFLKNADIYNPRTIKRCINFCKLHNDMNVNNGISSDMDMQFHLFIVKMLELENVKLYSKLLISVKQFKESYSELKKWLTDISEFNDNILYKNVLDCFGINAKNYYRDNVKMFAEYIFFSAPTDIISGEALLYAQKVYDIYRFIVKHGGKGGGNESLYNFANYIEKNKYIIFKFFVHNRPLYIICEMNRLSYERLELRVDSFSINANILKKYCYQTPILRQVIRYDRINYSCFGNEYIFTNIQDTSSQDAPIYKLLLESGIFDKATETEPQPITP